MKKETLKKYCEVDGLSVNAIQGITGESSYVICHWITEYGIKLKKNQSNIKPLSTLVDWKRVQEYYDTGKSWNECIAIKEFKLNATLISAARKVGLVNSRSDSLTQSMKILGKTHSEESKKKMSEARKKYLSLGNRPAWKTHNKFKSQPCEWLKKELAIRGFMFTEELQPLLGIGRYYSIDISFPEKRFAIEINGRQHYNPNGTLTPYYQERHDLITGDGWDIWEVPYYKTRNVGFLSEVQKQLHSRDIFGTGNEIIPYKPRKVSSPIVCKNVKPKKLKVVNIKTEYKRPSKRIPREELESLIWTKPLTKIATDFGISANAIKKWIKFYKLEYPRGPYWTKRFSGYTHEEALMKSSINA